MAELAEQFRNVSSGRARALAIPREHGAWGILLVPLVTGACVGVPNGSHVSALALFTTATIVLFWMRTPLESWIGTSPLRAQTQQERKIVAAATLVTGLMAAVALCGLFRDGQNRGLLVIGGVAAGAFALQAAAKLMGRRMRMNAQVIGAIGLTSTAAGAYYVVTGQLDHRALAVWGANWLLAGNQIHYVQLRLRNSRVQGVGEKLSRGRMFLVGQVGMLAVAAWASGAGLLPRFAWLTFVPVVLRGAWWIFKKPQSLQLHWLGVTELLHSITFAVLLIASFYVR